MLKLQRFFEFGQRLEQVCDEAVMLANGHVAMAIDRETLAQAFDAPHEFERRTIDLLRSNSAD